MCKISEIDVGSNNKQAMVGHHQPASSSIQPSEIRRNPKRTGSMGLHLYLKSPGNQQDDRPPLMHVSYCSDLWLDHTTRWCGGSWLWLTMWAVANGWEKAPQKCNLNAATAGRSNSLNHPQRHFPTFPKLHLYKA